MAALLRRYGAGARWYDIVSGERLIYAAGRTAGLRLLDTQPGDVVVDLGCGTGLNFAALVAAVGDTGMVVGIDRSPDMLAMAARRITAHRWSTVRLVQADATTLDPAIILGLARSAGKVGADRIIATYALSLLADRDAAWQRMLACMRPGGRVAIVDMQLPTGASRVFAPLARLACLTGGADIDAHPWQLLERDAAGRVDRVEVRGGHIVAAAGAPGRAVTPARRPTPPPAEG